MPSMDEKDVQSSTHIDDMLKTEVADGQLSNKSSDIDVEGDSNDNNRLEWTMKSRLATFFLASLYVGESSTA